MTTSAEGTVSRINGLLRYLGEEGIAGHYHQAITAAVTGQIDVQYIQDGETT